MATNLEDPQTVGVLLRILVVDTRRRENWFLRGRSVVFVVFTTAHVRLDDVVARRGRLARILPTASEGKAGHNDHDKRYSNSKSFLHDIGTTW